MRKIEQYSIQEGRTPLSGQELSQRFLDVDGRLHQLELLKISWQGAVAEVQNHGLERINGVLEPLLELARDLVGQLRQELSSTQQHWQDTILVQWQEILDAWPGVQNEMTGMQAELDAFVSESKTYTDSRTKYVKRLLPNWFAPSPDSHPYLPENQSVRGQDIINLPAASEAWAGLRFDQNDSNANQHLELHYWMSTSDTQPINFGLAMAKGHGPLVDTPWQPSHTYTIGDKIIPSRPNGCEYQMIEGTAGIGTVDLTTGKTATASESFSGYPPENAIDDNDNVAYAWGSNIGANPWWKVDLGGGGEKKVGKLRFKTRASDTWGGVKDFFLAGSNDDSAYTTIFSGQHGENDLWEEFSFDCSVAYRYWRITVSATWETTNHYAHIAELEMFELLGSTGVSGGGGYTENVLTGGTASALDYQSSYTPDKAFDADTESQWSSNTIMTLGNPWIKYDLGSGNSKCFARVRVFWWGSSMRPTSMKIQGSNNDADWDDLATVVPATEVDWEIYDLANTTSYRYHRLYSVNGPGAWFVLNEIEAMVSLGGDPPIWETSQNWTTVDNEITWKCVRASGGYDQVADITGRSVTASAFTPATLNFQLPGDGIAAGERVNLLAIRKVDAATQYWAKQDLGAATVTVGGASEAPYNTTTIAGLYDGQFDVENKWLPEHCSWHSAFNGSIIGAYAQIQFASAKEIRKIIVNQPWIYHQASSIKFQYSTDGSTWNDLQTFSGVVGENELEISSPVSAQHYRVVCNAETHQWSNGYRRWTVAEIEMYTYETNPGSGHQGDMHILDAYTLAQDTQS